MYVFIYLLRNIKLYIYYKLNYYLTFELTYDHMVSSM